ncbi:MAG: ribokinase [Clostridia bacterium]|nr:ribokinase [Clostridia bacterium]
MKVLVFGSFNIDKVYMLPHLPVKGETLYCKDYGVHVGGKGLNQALAFKKAGAEVFAAGKVGAEDGAYLTDYLSAGGVDVSAVDGTGTYTGHTIIEVDPEGQNQMILFGGANREIKKEDCDAILEKHGDADLILMEYETSCVEYMLERARKAGMRTAINPSPFVKEVKELPFEHADIIILNEFEGQSITGETEVKKVLTALYALNKGEIILTLGSKGATYYNGGREISVPAFKVDAIDTTGAGDTFTGYCLYALLSGKSPEYALRFGAAASALEVTRPGAAETIPDKEEVLEFLEQH